MENPDLALARTVDCSGSDASKLLVNPERVHRVGDPYDLVVLAQEVQKADEFIVSSASNKLILIAEQIRHLQQQARKVLEETKRDAELHHAACNFKKIVGHMYYLYRRPDATTHFSMISPQEWGSSCPHEFLGAYRLEADRSWTKSEDVQRRNKDLAMVKQLLSAEVKMSSKIFARPAIECPTEPKGSGLSLKTNLQCTKHPFVVDVDEHLGELNVEEPH